MITSAPKTTTPAASPADRIRELWFAREDVWPFQWWSAERQQGGYAKACQHRPPWIAGRCKERAEGTTCSRCEKFTPIPLSDRVIEMHLRNMVTAGSYQIGQDGQAIRWACLDFDDHGEFNVGELQDSVRLARMALADLNLPTSVESSGGSGWRCHLWTFFAAPVAAIKARVLLDAALSSCGLNEKPYIERFPKQSRAWSGYGNLVKVPFGVHRKTGERSRFLDDDFEPIEDIGAALDSITLVDPATVDFTIDMRHLELVEPNRTDLPPVQNFDYPVKDMARILTGCWYFHEVEAAQFDPKRSVHYEDWWNYLLMFARFGQAGAERILEFSAADERYDAAYTLNLIRYVREHGYHAPSCRRLRNGPGQIRCPQDPIYCGAS